MGLDVLDMIFRAEKAFRVKIRRGNVERLMRVHDPPDFTAGEFHDYLCQLCRTSGQNVPWSSWGRVKVILRDSLGVSPSQVRRDTLLKRDLGM